MITYCIPSKNNLRYLKTCISSIQKNSFYKNDIIVFVDQDNDGTLEWLKEQNIKYLLNIDENPKGIGFAYDAMFKASKTDLVVAFHADMILGIHADKNIIKHHQRNTVVCSTRIEPPLHPPGPEKIVMDFGIWPEDIKWKQFDEFVISESKSNENKTTGSSFAPWLIDRRDHLGHDPIFLSVFEDADLFRRFVLAGYKMIQSWDSLVYHLTCRGGQFAGADKIEDFQKKDDNWLQNNQISMMEYIRKWGGFFKEYGPCEPKPNKKYDIGIEILNCTEQFLNLEPYFNTLKVDIDCLDYINNAQTKSKFDISNKFALDLNNDIVIKVDIKKYDANQLIHIVHNIEDFIEQIKEIGIYEIDKDFIMIVSKLEVKNPKIKL
jgi:glycosyltransferase involved in cell wall biosynthesis